MADVQDVAAFILTTHGEMTAMKLQKLVYYSLAWHAVWEDSALFYDRIEAWANGPVCPNLYQMHKERFRLGANHISGNPEKLSDGERSSIEAVLRFYGEKRAQELSDLTHAEKPWLIARTGVPTGEMSTNEITLASMVEYYSGL